MGGRVQARLRPVRRAVLLGFGAFGVSAVLPRLACRAVAGAWPDHASVAAAGPSPDRIVRIAVRIAATAGAERAMLYEEDPDNQTGIALPGEVVWRVETIVPRPGQPKDVSLKATVDIPDRRMRMSWELQRNHDKSLPASHTVEFIFTLPPDFSHREIRRIPGLLMSQEVKVRGTPLVGPSVKVTSGFFLIGLSSHDEDVERNMRLLKEQPWLSVPILYDDDRRAILAFAKGESGARAFTQVFAAWDSAPPDQEAAPPDLKIDRVRPPSPFPPEIVEPPHDLPRP